MSDNEENTTVNNHWITTVESTPTSFRMATRAAARQPAPVVGDADIIDRVDGIIKDWELAEDETIGDVMRGNTWFLASGIVQTVADALAAQSVQVPTLDADGHLMEHLREIQREQNAYWGKDDYESQFAMEIAELTGVWFEQKAFWTGECWEGDDVEWDLSEWKSRQAEQAKGGS